MDNTATPATFLREMERPAKEQVFTIYPGPRHVTACFFPAHYCTIMEDTMDSSPDPSGENLGLNVRLNAIEERVNNIDSSIVSKLKFHISVVTSVITIAGFIVLGFSYVSRTELQSFIEVQARRIDDRLGQLSEKPDISVYVDKYLQPLEGAEIIASLEDPVEFKGDIAIPCIIYFTIKNIGKSVTDNIKIMYYNKPPLTNTSISSDEKDFNNQDYAQYAKLPPGMAGLVRLPFFLERQFIHISSNKSDVKIKIYYGGSNLHVTEFKVLIDTDKAKELFKKSDNTPRKKDTSSPQ